MIGKKAIYIILSFTLLCWSCGDYNKVVKGHDIAKKESLARQLFEDGDYFKAYPLLEELYTIYKGGRKGADFYYMLAMCDFNTKDYVMSAYRLKNFAVTYPFNPKAEECLFNAALSYYLNTPGYSLDQSNTNKALKELQLFANRYSESALIDSCNTLVDELQHKLETKAFQAAMLYYKTGEYRAAIVSINNFEENYPVSDYGGTLEYTKVLASYSLARNSIESKKPERLSDVVKTCNTYLNSYPDSKYANRIQNIAEKAGQERLDALKALPSYYFNIGRYEEAVVAVDDIADEPDSILSLTEAAAALKVKASFELAMKGDIQMREAGLKRTVLLADQFITNFPNSSVQKEIELIQERSRVEQERVLKNTPGWYFAKGRYKKAATEAMRIAPLLPDSVQRSRILYLGMKAWFNFSESKREAGVAGYKQCLDLYTAQKDIMIPPFDARAKSLSAKAAVNLERQLISQAHAAYIALFEENSNFAARFEKAMKLYTSISSRLSSESGKKKLDRIVRKTEKLKRYHV